MDLAGLICGFNSVSLTIATVIWGVVDNLSDVHLE